LSSMSITFDNVSVKREARAILSRITFSTGEVPVFILFGPSGSGKTSLLRLINRLDEPDSGEICVLGRPIREHLPTVLRRRVGMIFQEPRLMDGTVEANIRFAAEYHGIPLDMEAALERVGLPGGGSRDVRELSGGEKQRVALARALAVDPDVLLLDEPTASLDRQAVLKVEELLLNLTVEGKLRAIFVTHDLAQVSRLGGTGLVLSGGTVVHEGHIPSYLDGNHV